ncbi:hypothetical protein C1Y40_01307 [Mycobacterium talmoniae]|uniref:Uncharacterized protein n=1 Tax=Mycobacterium talmoniae TaxID=1858794 RepID=A0A2S8BPA7_9MYCO|nr:hypothetical protein C1Y40_01307 [Mycobacterium talmoniae]
MAAATPQPAWPAANVPRHTMTAAIPTPIRINPGIRTVSFIASPARGRVVR